METATHPAATTTETATHPGATTTEMTTHLQQRRQRQRNCRNDDGNAPCSNSDDNTLCNGNGLCNGDDNAFYNNAFLCSEGGQPLQPYHPEDWLKPNVVLEAFEVRAARICVAYAQNLSKFSNPEESK
ncbi:uncharacterized protein [Phaseolus vulgaris]|uniref:uncharacterized protein isoform X2 n=1 Tax=Phaseolus vulgaris TaxID=3885 RepID=UPI0035C949DE